MEDLYGKVKQEKSKGLTKAQQKKADEWDKSYKRLFRRGKKNAILELTLISCGFNLYKYHNKKQRQLMTA